MLGRADEVIEIALPSEVPFWQPKSRSAASAKKGSHTAWTISCRRTARIV